MLIAQRSWALIVPGWLLVLASAEDGLAQSASFPLEPITVMGSGGSGARGKPIPEAGRQSLPYASTGVSREEFEELPNQRLGDVLRRLPGVTMGGPPGENKDVRLRGLDKEFTRTQFEGVQLTDGGEKREFQVFRFPSFLVDEVEIIRNPTAEFEADGIAGRINVGLRDIPLQREIHVEGGLGRSTGFSFGEDRSLQVGYGERFGRFGAQLGYSHILDPIFKEKQKLVVGQSRDAEEEIKEGEFNDLFADFAYFGARHELHVKPIVLDFEEEKDKELVKFKADGARDKSERELADELRRTVALIVNHAYEGSRGRIDTVFAYSDTIEDKDNDKIFLKADGSLDKFEDEVENKQDRTYEIGTKVTRRFNFLRPHEFKFGGAYRTRDRFRDKTKLEIKGGKTTDKTVPKDVYFLEETYAAGFVQDTIALTRRFSITPGIRYEHVIQEPMSGAGDVSRDTISDLLPSIHALYRPTARTTLRAGVSRQVNRPKFDELAPFREEKGNEIVEGNPNLEPARAWSYDAGGDYASRHFFFGFNFFRREIVDIIEQVDTGIDIGGKDLFRVENVGDGFVHGVELEQRVSLALLGVPVLSNFSIQANQTFIDSELTDDTGFMRPFREQPSTIANLALVYERPSSGTKLSLGANYVSDISNLQPLIRETIESETFLEIYGETKLHENVSVFAWVSNLTGENRRKVKVEGAKREIEFEDTGRTFFVGLKKRF